MSTWVILLYGGAALLCLRSFVQLSTNYRRQFEQQAVSEELSRMRREIEQSAVDESQLHQESVGRGVGGQQSPPGTAQSGRMTAGVSK